MKKFLLGLVLLLPIICPLFGHAQATNGFHRVAIALARAFQGVTAQVIPNAKVTVTSTATGLAATIYSDPALSSQITPAVITADNSGNYGYYIPLGYCVTETITSPGQGTQVIKNICNNSPVGVTSAQGLFPIQVNSLSSVPATGAITVSCASSNCGLGIQMSLTPPVGGQWVYIFPTSFSVAASGATFTQNVGNQSGQMGSLAYCSAGSGTATITWNGFLAALNALGIPAANVTGVQPFAYSQNTYGPGGGTVCGPIGAVTYVPNLGGVSVIASGTGGVGSVTISPSTSPWNIQESQGVLTGVTGTNFNTIQIQASDAVGGSAVGPTLASVPLVGLWVQYTGTVVNQPTTINIIPPLSFDSITNSLKLNAPIDAAFDTGTADNYAVSLPWLAPSPLVTVTFIPLNDNLTTTPKLNLNGVGQLTILGPTGLALQAHDLKANIPATVKYGTGNGIYLQNPQVSGGGGGTALGTKVYTASTTASVADAGYWIKMNCTSACSYTLGAQPSSTWAIVLQSIGTTTATVVMSGTTYNGGSSPPVLLLDDPIGIQADTQTSTNYLGALPLVAGSNITVTPGPAGKTIATTSGGVTWPASTDIVISNGTNSPNGLAPINGNCVVGSGGVWTSGSCSGGGSGVQYNPTSTVYYFLSSSVMADDNRVTSTAVTAGAWSCNGTTCTVNTTTNHNLTTNSWVDVSTLTGWFGGNPLGGLQDTTFGSFKVASTPSSTQFTFAYTRNTGSGTGGSIYDASYWAVYMSAVEPFLNGHGTILYWWSPLSSAATNFNSFVSCAANPTYVVIQAGQNDINSGRTAAQIEGNLQTIWAAAHTAGCKVIQGTILPTNYGVSPPDSDWQVTQDVNLWIRQQPLIQATASNGQYWDQIIDFGSYGFDTMAQTGARTGSSAAGSKLVADNVNDAFGHQGGHLANAPAFMPWEGGTALTPQNWFILTTASGSDTSTMTFDQVHDLFTWTQFYGTAGSTQPLFSYNWPNAANGNHVCNPFQVNTTTNNAFSLCLGYTSSGSTSNYFSIGGGTGGNTDLIKLFANGGVQLPAIHASSGSQPLQVDTSGNITAGTAPVSSISATSPILVNGGAGPVSGAATVSCPTCTTSSGGPATSMLITVTNAGTTGTTANTLTKLTGAPSTAVITSTTDTGGAVGICTSSCSTTGTATIQTEGLVSCIFSGATTAGDYVQISSATAGNCADGGATYPTSGQVLGRVLSTNGAAGTYQIDLFPSEIKAASGGSSAWTNITSTLTSTGCGTNTGGVCTISGTTTTDVQFSSIPAHNRMQIVVYGEESTGVGASAGFIVLNFNSDSTAGHYSLNGLAQIGAGAVTSNQNNSTTLCEIGQMNNTGGNHIIADIPFYADTNFAKTVSTQNGGFAATGAGNNFYEPGTCAWSGTAAITTVDIKSTPGHFVASSKIMILVQD